MHAGEQTPKQQAAGSLCWKAAAALEQLTRAQRARCAGCCCRRRSCRRTYRRSLPCWRMTIHPGRPLAPRQLPAPANPAGRKQQHQQQMLFRALATLDRAAQQPQPSPWTAAALLRCPGPACRQPHAQAAGPGSQAGLVQWVQGRGLHVSLRMDTAELGQAKCALPIEHCRECWSVNAMHSSACQVTPGVAWRT